MELPPPHRPKMKKPLTMPMALWQVLFEIPAEILWSKLRKWWKNK